MVTKIVTTWSSCIWNGILPQHTLFFVWYAHNYYNPSNIYALGKLFTSVGTDNASRQISRCIFVPNRGCCWYMLLIHISYTSYQKGNALMFWKRLMNDWKHFFFYGQGSSGYLPSSMEYSTCRFPSTLAGQTHEGPSYQTWHSPSK